MNINTRSGWHGGCTRPPSRKGRMTGGQEPYPTGRGVESAIKEAAKRAAQADPSMEVNKRIQLEYFNRF